ncbi:MAG: histidine phosphatase family protein [Acidimicrobiia bacterium]|nr:histidine phosphatase family protein [Acidimicrobiia bacterium]
MPELILLRHAKSDWDAAFDHDRERPLNPRGRRAAASMGRALRLMHRVPDRIVTSPAVRARTTVEIAAAAGTWDVPIEVEDRLYGGGVDDVLGVLRERGGDARRMAAVGHEPTWSALAAAIIGGGSLRVPTGMAMGLDVPEWTRLGHRSGRLLWMLPPRLLTDGDLELGDL